MSENGVEMMSGVCVRRTRLNETSLTCGSFSLSRLVHPAGATHSNYAPNLPRSSSITVGSNFLNSGPG
jgi:hypothetical protein